jgi:uracil-DNA glycosylase
MPDTLTSLLSNIRACRICRDAPLFGAVLPHEPRPVLRISPEARILIAGQAPGTRVHASGLPFTDPSGVRLRDWLGLDEAMFYNQSLVAIVPMGFCFPGLTASGADLPPRRECQQIWHDRVFASRSPFPLMVTVGLHAARYHLKRLGHAGLIGPSLTAMVSDWRRIVDEAGLFALPHPSWRNNAWLKANPWFSDKLLPVLRQQVVLACRNATSIMIASEET